jgi:hypothetical protein
VKYLVKDPAIYFIRTVLLRPAREIDYRFAPLYHIFTAFQTLTSLSDYYPQSEAARLLESGGAWTLWNECSSFENTGQGEHWRWRARVDTMGDDVCLLYGIEKEKRLLEQTAQQIVERGGQIDNERTRLCDEWVSKARVFREELDKNIVGVKAESPDTNRLRATGEAWLYCFEWETAPDWKQFGQARFKQGRYLVFDWGLLGLDLDRSSGVTPVFEAHSMATTGKLNERDRFVFSSFTDFLIFYLKVTQFLAARYRHSQSRARALDAELERLSHDINQMQGRLNLQRAERSLERAASRLGDFRSVVAEISIDLHTAKIDCKNAENLLLSHLQPGSEESMPILRPLNLYLEQAGKDLEYYRLTLDSVMQTMDLLKLKTEILRVRFTNILAAIGAGFGIFLGLGQLIDPNYLKDFLRRWWPWFPISAYGNLSRAVICLLLAGMTSLIVYGLLNRFLTAKSKATL